MGKLRRLLLVAAIAAVGSVSAALAQGQTAGSPLVTTQAATSIGSTSAVLNGTINPEGQQTDYAFQWGPTSALGHETTPTSAGSASSTAAVSAPLAGLTPGTKYHFRAIAITSTGAVIVGAESTLATHGTAPPPSTPPTATTRPATQVAQTSMTLNGIVDPKGHATTYYFEYGTTTNFGFETSPVGAGAGTGGFAVAVQVSGLASNTTYHFRLVAVNVGGTALGGGRAATTAPLPPAVVTGGASKVALSSAVITGLVNPEGQATTYYFQFGTTTSYGLQTPTATLGSGTSNILAQSDLEGLTSNTSYHYRVVAQNKGGISYGADRTLKTAGHTLVRSRLRVLGRMAFVSRRGWIDVAMGCFAGQSRCGGRVRLTHGAATIGAHRFRIAAANGAVEVFRLNRTGRSLFGRGYRHPVLVQVTATTTGGQRVTRWLRVARWF
jgi:phosphodiesterase/alkaline phosphatase D-like protein